jgi:hypothetical protein
MLRPRPSSFSDLPLILRANQLAKLVLFCRLALCLWDCVVDILVGNLFGLGMPNEKILHLVEIPFDRMFCQALRKSVVDRKEMDLPGRSWNEQSDLRVRTFDRV